VLESPGRIDTLERDKGMVRYEVCCFAGLNMHQNRTIKMDIIARLTMEELIEFLVVMIVVVKLLL